MTTLTSPTYRRAAAAQADRLRAALEDVREGLARRQLWLALGWNDILQRYRRSALGPFWLTASMAILVVALGVLYSELFRMPIAEFIPYLTVGLLIWNFMSGFALESATLFVGSETFIKQVRLPYSLHVFRSAWSKLLIFAHNFVVYFAVLAYFAIWPGIIGLLFVPGLVLIIFNGMLIGTALGLISARFRDVPQVISSLVQILFFVTPIMWKPELLQTRSYFVTFNPLYYFIEIARAPLLGQVPPLTSYGIATAITFLNLIVVAALFTRFRSRISYWV